VSAISLPVPGVYGPEFGFRENTKVTRYEMNFIFNDEGMGGYLNYCAVTTWMAKNCPWIDGRIFVEQFLVPIIQDIHAEFKHWKVMPSNQFQRLVTMGTATIGPMVSVGGIPAKREFTTALGTHPIDVGSGYYLSRGVAPADMLLPVLDYPESRLLPQVKKLRGQYVVFTAGGTTPIRTMRGRDLNPLIDYVLSIGLTPVFLGKRDLLGDGKSTTAFADDTNYDKGVDLRDQTAVKDAACIMQHAKCTVGIDGGLLHLAALMQNSKIVFGYNITSVEHRVPRRNHGRTVNVSLSKEELACTGCQSRWPNMNNISYDRCFYGDNKCLDLLFANDSEKFKRAICEVMSV